ncbi:MAG: hypothetical protein IJ622_09900 [Bacteroidales bacterium]|nr:hypothetical protein [Bacteroidales bacterium]
MSKTRILFVILLISNMIGFSQNPSRDSIAPQKQTALPSPTLDSTFVTYKPYSFDSIFLNASKVIDTTTFHAVNYEVLERENTIYSTLSNTGLAHKSMRFGYRSHVGFDMSFSAFSAFMQDESNMLSYQSVLPYSEIRYLMTATDKEQHLNVRFGRQFAPRLFVAFTFNTDYSPGAFKNNKSVNNYFWVNTHYFTKNQRYAVSAFWYRNKLEMQENGGITNDEAYSSHTETDNSVITTNLNSANNYVISSGIGLEHYFNLLPQIIKTTNNETPQRMIDSIGTDSLAVDSIVVDTQSIRQKLKVRKFTLGRICHSFNYLNSKLYYNESSPSAAFYQSFDTLFNTSKSTDTTRISAFKNSLQWNSLGYQKYNDDVPFYLYAGVNHGYYTIKSFDYLEGETRTDRNINQIGVSGGIIINLFKSTRITGQGELITLGHQIGDFDVKGQWKQFIGTSSNNYGSAIFDFEIKRQSANWFEERYNSNHFRWDNDFHAATYLTFNLRYNYKKYSIGAKQTSISNLIYFGTDARPAQYEGMFSIREAYLSFHQNLWRFELEGFASMQKSSNEDVIHLPLFMGQLKVAYSQPIFRKAAVLHPSLTVRYFTKYYADAYMPATRTFYLQNEVQIGNFPYIDLAIALKVKKATVFVAYSNMFLLTGNYNSFIAPHYPMRDSRIFIGINWRLFN